MLTKILTSGLTDSAATAAKVAAGAVVQVVSVSTSTWQGYNTVIPFLTPPTTSDGAQILSTPITLKQASNQVLVRLQVPMTTTSAASGTCAFAVFRGATLIGATFATHGAAANQLITAGIEALDTPGAVGPFTYTVRFGPISSAYYAYLGGQSTGAWASNMLKTTLTLTEIKA